MKRLFWKFFISLFLAQIITTAVVIGLYWYRDGPHIAQMPADTNQMPSDSSATVMPLEHHHSPRFPYRPIVVGLFTSLIIAYLLARNMAKPINILRKGFDEISRGNFSHKVTPELHGRNDALADLGVDFDQTSEKLEQLLTSQKRLLHDVSHELRSPLARMQIAVDILGRTPERAPDMINRLSRDMQRLDTLVDSILTLAKLECSGVWEIKDRVDLCDLVNDAVADISFEARELGMQVTQSVPDEPAIIRGNQELLHRAIENILRNAIAFNSAGKPVEVRLAKVKSDWCITVIDNGPGVPADQLEYIFKPFHRAFTKDQAIGYGLGLAIVRQTLQLHGGLVSAQNRVEIGARGFEVNLYIPEER